ncbi:hypothetical protein HDU96_005691 [Phlyctochytrium bullatum]|nr:hypothetical protein HDU96_005691 [Phlyctochytrium bullatum]
MSGARFSADSGAFNGPRTISAAFRKDFQNMNSYQKHKRFMNDYMLFYGGDKARQAIKEAKERRGKTEAEILKENHRFLRDDEDEDEEVSWEQRLAKKYYDQLFKEYCLANMERYKEGKIALRWRTQKEVVEGKGQFTCGNINCSSPSNAKLKAWEVNFGYKEDGEVKNALVKLRLCDPCAYKLNYRKIQEREQERAKAEAESTIAAASRSEDSRSSSPRRSKRSHEAGERSKDVDGSSKKAKVGHKEDASTASKYDKRRDKGVDASSRSGHDGRRSSTKSTAEDDEDAEMDQLFNRLMEGII